MTTVRRATLVAGGLAFVAGLLLCVLPTRGEAIVGFVPPGGEIVGEVNCGTIFSETKWSNADGCEGPLLVRLGATVMSLVVAVIFGGVGLVLLFLQARRGS